MSLTVCFTRVAPGAMVAVRGGNLPTVRRVSQITNYGGADRSES